MRKTEQVFIQFDPNEVDRTFRFNTRIRGVREIYLKAIAHEAIDQSALVIAMDNCSPAIATENLVGYPVPILVDAADAGTHDGGWSFEFPLLISRCNIPSMQSLRVRLSYVNGAALTHQGISMWLECRCDPEVYDGASVRAEQWLKSGTALSGIGQNDYRWDYVPSAKQLAENLATLERRFSILSGEKQK